MFRENCRLASLSQKISGGLENFFYNIGIFVSQRPYKVIAATLVVVLVCSIGLVNFYEEKNMVKLWIPAEIDFAQNYHWLMKNFPPDVRFNSLIFEDEVNVLRPEVIKQMFEIHKNVEKASTAEGITWNDVCMKLPIVSVDIDNSVKREVSKRSVDTTENMFDKLSTKSRLSKRNVDKRENLLDKLSTKSRLSKRSVDEPKDDDDSWSNFFDDFSTDEDEDGFESQVNDDTFKKIVSESSSLNKFDPSVLFYPDQYCPVVENMKMGCFETSILEMFANKGGYDSQTEDFIKNLTQEHLIDLINTKTESGAFMVEQNFHTFLGGITRNASGHIIGAKSTYIRWFIKAKMTKEIVETKDNNKKRNNLGLDEQVDEITLSFEEKLLEVLKNSTGYPEGLQSFANVQRSYGDLSTKAIWEDVKYLIVGYMLVFAYVQIMLGRFNRVEQRSFLGFMALVSIGLGVVTSFGLCSLIGLSYGPMHSLIPCLLVGLGVDNAFVLVQAVQNVNEKELEVTQKGYKRSLPERFGDAMRHAGVGVTITSTTDVIVFLVGGTTVLPSLRSYSFFTGVGIAATYFIQITFFTSCLYLDQKRIEEKRDGVFFCCVTHNNFKSNDFSKRNLLQNVFKHLGKTLQKPFTKIFVLLITLTLLSLGIYGTLQLEVKFDYVEFLPQDSSLYRWFAAKEKHYPDEGEMGIIYFADFDLRSEIPRLKKLTDAFRTQNEFISSFDSWYPGFEEYVNDNFLPDSVKLPDGAQNITDLFFRQKLTQYLFSPHGARYKNWFQFEDQANPVCGEPAPAVKMCSMQFVHPAFSGFEENIQGMNWVKNTIRDVNFPGVSFAIATSYSRWEIDEVIAHELYRNLLLALICVSITTLLLLANVKASLFVIICVLFTLTDVGGFMYFWGLTIDIVAATNIIISVGLCVDFAAHLTHTFMKESGNLNDRLIGTMVSIGPAIFHGGISTLLAVVMLADSISHVFQSYFKIFFLMIILGLFHGLIFLPVLLSLLGPDPYHTIEKSEEDPYHVVAPSEEDPIEEESKPFRPDFLTAKILSEGRETNL